MPIVADFVIQPAKHVLPAYRISPFTTKDIAFNRNLPRSATIDDYFRERFKGKRFIYCESGRHAIGLALEYLKADAKDLVAILTTSNNYYVSGCITREIEKSSGWTRRIDGATKLIFVNHEFGFAYEELSKLKEHRLPIIEDACLSFASDNAEGTLSRVGELTVFSFPKFFPIQAGGLLVCDENVDINETVPLEAKRYMQKVLSFHIKHLDSTKQKRRQIFDYFTLQFEKLGFSPRFQLTKHSIPGVFMFKTDGKVDLPAMKMFLSNQGIECSVFYGEDAFFLPLNERMEKEDVDYFFEAVRFFVERISNQSEC